jgi:cytochrome o ubiquinol oxidase subunit 2
MIKHRVRWLMLPALVFHSAACRAAGVLDPAGPIGSAEKTMLLDALAIMMCVVAPVIIATLAFAWWFRASNIKAKYIPDWEYSGRIEIAVWSIPAMVVLFLGGIGWVGSHELDPPKPIVEHGVKPLKVQVVSIDWKWLFIYPDQKIASVNRLEIPAGVPVEFTLTSADVMNAFFVPQLGTMIYTMAGMSTHLNLEASDPGTYPGLSSHFSGDGFSDMRFDTVAVSPDEFRHWAESTASSDSLLDEAAYKRLAQPSQHDPVSTFGHVEPGLFDKIVALSAPGTMTGALGEMQPNPASSPSPHKMEN